MGTHLMSCTTFDLHAGQEFVADNPEGAHVRGLNANMINVDDLSGNEDSTQLHDTSHHPADAEVKEVQDIETFVRQFISLTFFSLNADEFLGGYGNPAGITFINL